VSEEAERWQTVVGHTVGCRGLHGKGQGPDQPFVERPVSGLIGVEVDVVQGRLGMVIWIRVSST
jgi:hypothetical protein